MPQILNAAVLARAARRARRGTCTSAGSTCPARRRGGPILLTVRDPLRDHRGTCTALTSHSQRAERRRFGQAR
ncbi:hypothetical protein [Streptomyces phaeoluteigriseus]